MGPKSKHARLTETELAEESGKTLRMIRKREADGTITRGADGLFDRHLALTAILARATGGGRPRKDSAKVAAQEVADDDTDWTRVLKKEQALKARIERLELQGRLVRRTSVESLWAEQATQVRDQLLELGPSLAGRLAAETDARECAQLVTTAVRAALERLVGGVP